MEPIALFLKLGNISPLRHQVNPACQVPPDLLELLLTAAKGGPLPGKVRWREGVAVGVVAVGGANRHGEADQANITFVIRCIHVISNQSGCLGQG